MVVTAVGSELAKGLRDLGQVRLVLAYGPVLAAPLIGQQAAKGWIRLRTSHEEREYAVDTAMRPVKLPMSRIGQPPRDS